MTCSDRKQFFLDRIGKRLFRYETCRCPGCTNIFENGLVVENEKQALYLWESEGIWASEQGNEDLPLYFDSKPEHAFSVIR